MERANLKPTTPTDTRRAWGAWLETFDWSYFVTFTFERPVCAATGRALYQKYVRWLEQRHQKPVASFFALEVGAAGLLHVHAVILAAELSSSAVKAAWRWGRSDVSRFARNAGGCSYITKSLNDGGID